MKNGLFVLIICSIPFLSAAQEAEKNFLLGLTASPNLGWESSPSGSNEGRELRSGFSYGLIADLGFAKNYYFSTGFVVTTLNSKSGTGGDLPATLVNHLRYIELPLTLKLKSNENSSGRFYGQFGLGTGIKVRATQDYSSSGVSESRNIGDGTNIVRLSLVAGGGAEWNIGRNLSLLTGVSLNNGFTNVFKDNDSRSSYVVLNLGIFF